jgi:alpha-1,6-mannosyltransferase
LSIKLSVLILPKEPTMQFLHFNISKWDAIRLATLAVYLAGLVWLGYFTVRTDFMRLVTLYTVLFGLYIFIIHARYFQSSIKIIIGMALLLRLALFLMRPNLTDDYFRYIWDGLLVASGHNPYLSLPSEVIVSSSQNIPGISAALYGQLNSPNFYSAYPPAAQLIFGLSAKLAGANVFGNIILLRIITLLAEFGTMALMYRLSTMFNLPRTTVLLYAFNPLVIMELTGNLHLEAVMIFFLLLAIYLLVNEKGAFSAVSFALAAGTKLVPLIFLPFLIKRLGARKAFIYFLILGAATVLLFLPFLGTGSLTNYFSSLGLFFRVLQFNSAIYSIFQSIGFQNVDAGVLNLAHVLLPVLCFLGITLIAIRERARGWQSLFPVMLFSLTLYLFTTANVHAWYLTPLVMLSAFTRFRYIIPWTFLVIFTYGAYKTIPYSENLWVVAVEYITVGAWIVYELRRNSDGYTARPTSPQKNTRES